MKEENPCNGCEKRWVIADRSCHSVCKDGLGWKAKLDAKNKAKKAAEKAWNDATGFAIESAERTMRRQRYKKP